MNNIDYLITCILREIPREILNMTFVPPNYLGTITPNLHHLIKSTIITDWVLKDCNVVAGIETIIDITNVPIDYVNMGMVLHVGLGPTGGKRMTSVLSVGYGYNAMAGGQPGIASALTEPLQTSDARCQLIGENIVYVDGYTGVWLTNLRCVLENDAEFNNIPQRALTILSDMCTLAAKAYIYNTMTVRLSTGEIVRGIAMSRIMDLVNGYSDANQMYRELLTTKWAKINYMSDKVSMNRHIRRSVPS